MKKILFIILLFISAHSYGQRRNPIVGTNGLYLVGDTMYLISADKTDTVRGFWYNNDFYWKYNNTDSTLFLSSDGSARKTNIGGGGSGDATSILSVPIVASPTHFGDIMYYNGSGWDILYNTANYGDVISSNGNGLGLTWATPNSHHYTLSVSAAQALQTAHTFDTSGVYKIIDPGSFTSSFIILQATTDSTLSPTGTGKFINSVMSTAVDAEIGYDLTLDLVWKVVSETGGGNTGNYVEDHGGLAIPVLPFDNVNCVGNKIYEGSLGQEDGFDLGSGSFSYNILYGGADVSMNNNSTVTNCVLYPSSILDVGLTSASLADRNILGAGSRLKLYDNHTVTSSHIGESKTVSLSAIASGYTATGKFYTAEGSNFEIYSSDLPSINPGAVNNNEVLLNDCPFVGVVFLQTATDTIASIQEPSGDHEITIRAEGADFILNTSPYLQVTNTLSLTFPMDFKDGSFLIYYQLRVYNLFTTP